MMSKIEALPWLPQPSPYLPPWYDDDIAYAVQAVSQGIANARQQKLFWQYLMYVTAGSDEFQDLSYRPEARGGALDTAFAEGKRFVAIAIRKLLRTEVISTSKITEKGKGDPVPSRQARFESAKQQRKARRSS